MISRYCNEDYGNRGYDKMKFYGRKAELKLLEDSYRRINDSAAEMVVITGRRRMGKTSPFLTVLAR